jgi:hypothetical protein
LKAGLFDLERFKPSGGAPMGRITSFTAVWLTALFLAFNPAWADPNLSDRQNYEEGIKLHQQGKFQDAYEFYFRDMSPTVKTQKWLADYKDKYLNPAQPYVAPSAAPITSEPAAVSAAQAKFSPKKKTSIFFGVGYDVPVGPEEFGDLYKMGANFGFGVGTKVSRITTVQFDFHYASFGLNERAMLDELYAWTRDPDVYDFEISGGAIHNMSALMNAKLHFTGSDAKTKPYFIGGLGFGIWSNAESVISYQGDSEPVAGTSDTYFEVRVGFGLDIRLNESTVLFIEDNGYSIVTEGDNATFGSLDLGLRFNI